MKYSWVVCLSILREIPFLQKKKRGGEVVVPEFKERILGGGEGGMIVTPFLHCFPREFLHLLLSLSWTSHISPQQSFSTELGLV